MQASTVSFIDTIQSAISTYIPTAESIAAVVATLFNPAIVPTVEAVSGAVNVIVGELETVVKDVSTSASAMASMAVSTSPVSIGKTAHGVAVTGYRRS